MITPNQVSTFSISKWCDSRYPCAHSCRIKLLDQRSIDAYLHAEDIRLLIEAIAKENIRCHNEDAVDEEPSLQCITHLRYKVNSEYIPGYSKTAESILTELFCSGS